MPRRSEKKEKKQERRERKPRKAKDKVVEEDSKPSADSDVDEEEPPLLTHLSENEKQFLMSSMVEEGQQEDIWWWDEGNGRILHELMHPNDNGYAHLDIQHYYLWGDKQQIKNDIKTAERYGIFIEKFPGKTRGSSGATSGRIFIRTMDIIKEIPLWGNYLKEIKALTRQRWLGKKMKADDTLFTEQDRVVIKKLWVGKALGEAENVGVRNAGDFNKHFDNYGFGSEERIIASICDVKEKGKNKVMGFDYLGDEVRFKAPHGTVVIMDKVASGADGSKRYSHFIEGAAGTYTLVVEVGIAVGSEGDLGKYVGKSEEGSMVEEMEMKDVENHSVDNVYIGE